ncbi:hypothetical protein [Nannocystis pusilla]|uniref:hypothetical protein n=1 Tax=Nannocystis pusilla TaxID=889268 RepID=UPI003B808E44
MSYEFAFARWFVAGDLDHDDLLDVVVSRRLQQMRSHMSLWARRLRPASVLDGGDETALARTLRGEPRQRACQECASGV